MALLPGSSPHARGTVVFRLPEGGVGGIIPACAGNSGRGRDPRGGHGDHPRMRGEQRACRQGTSPGSGSSPHARGTDAVLIVELAVHGIIPACAGNSGRCGDRRHRRRDHPRMRGEQWCLLCSTAYRRGSSPHARGTDADSGAPLLLLGIIPACAGNSRQPFDASSKAQDHPRMRGEQSKLVPALRALLGSSPHARGTVLRRTGGMMARRIIPACAGNSHARRASARGSRDHPRMRGEQSRRAPCASARPGSSPHARGTAPPEPHGRDRPGIIPACAGNRGGRVAPPAAYRDHPRMRGEQLLPGAEKIALMGSSPHARGTAWACRRRRCLRQDHPRMRGEQAGLRRDDVGGVGSSPHARGTAIGLACIGLVCRIIPACAGNRQPGPGRCGHVQDHPRMRGEQRLFSCLGGPGGRIIPACAGNRGHEKRQ